MVTLEQIERLLENNNRKRDQNLDTKLNEMREKLSKEISDTIEIRIKDIPVHKTSPDTKKELDYFRSNCYKVSGEYSQQIKEMKQSLDENQKMTKEMYDLFTKSGWGMKTTLKIFLTVGSLAASIVGVIELLKRMK